MCCLFLALVVALTPCEQPEGLPPVCWVSAAVVALFLTGGCRLRVCCSVVLFGLCVASCLVLLCWLSLLSFCFARISLGEGTIHLDGSICARAGSNPDGEHGREWCYVDAQVARRNQQEFARGVCSTCSVTVGFVQLLGGGRGEPAWGYCGAWVHAAHVL